MSETVPENIYNENEFIYLFQEPENEDGSFDFNKQLLKYYNNDENVNTIHLDEDKIYQTVERILNSNNIKNMQRAFLVLLGLSKHMQKHAYNIVGDFLTYDKFSQTSDYVEATEFDIPRIFTGEFYQQLEKSRILMASAIHIFHHFFEAYKFKHGETFRVPYYLILANENLEHQLEYKDACPIPEVVFEQYKENNTTQTIEQEYKLMIPFITKKKEYDAQEIPNITKEAIIRIGDQELNDIKKLQTHIDEGEQISLKLTREVNLEFAPISMDLIWFFIAQTNCMKCISNSKNIYWFNTDIEKNDDNAKNLEILGLLISAYITNKTQTSIHFPLVFYKKLLSKAISFHDLKEVYPNQHHDAKDLYQDCIESPDYNQFDIIDDNGNVVNLSNEQYDFLKPDDTEFLNINPDNRDEYIRRVVDYFYNFKIQWHFHHLLKGFNTNKIPDYVKYNFRLQEYDMLLSKSLQNKCPLGFRTCPKCGEIYYKDDGCNNVVCNICKTKFFFYNGGFNGIPGKQFENPPDYERFVLHKKVPQKRLDEFYEKYPYLKQNQEAYDEFYAQFPDLKQE